MSSTENVKSKKLYHKNVPFLQNIHNLYMIFASI